jgi:hypothetical protein
MNHCRHVSIAIDRSPADVYAFVVEPHNLPRWAAGLDRLGDILLRFTDRNTLGVLDHVVTLPSGESALNPLRVLSNGDGSEVVFSLFRLPGLTAEAFEADVAAVARDLERLRSLLEQPLPVEVRGSGVISSGTRS